MLIYMFNLTNCKPKTFKICNQFFSPIWFKSSMCPILCSARIRLIARTLTILFKYKRETSVQNYNIILIFKIKTEKKKNTSKRILPWRSYTSLLSQRASAWVERTWSTSHNVAAHGDELHGLWQWLLNWGSQIIILG